MEPRAQLSAAIDEAGRALAQALGDRVACIALYGSAASDQFSPRHSDVNLAIVLREISFADLRLIGTILEQQARSSGLRFATPLVVRPEFVRAARDSFPIELDDIRLRHRVLAGEDLFAHVRVSAEALRTAAEREARTMLLRLHGLAVHRPPEEELQGALARIGSTAPLIGDLLRDHGHPQDRSRGRASLEALGKRIGFPLPRLIQLAELREGAAAWPDEERLDRFLGALIVEVEGLVRAIDANRS